MSWRAVGTNAEYHAVGVHAVTSANALHHAFRTSRSRDHRLLLLLQGVGWMGHIAGMLHRDGKRRACILGFDGDQIPDDPARAAEEILTLVSTNAPAAGRKAFAYAKKFDHPDELFRGARRLIYAKATEAHEYKYPAAIFEDIDHVAPAWRPHMLSAAMFYLQGSTLPDSPVMERAREAVRKL